LAAGIGVLAGTAALLVPSTTSVAVTTHSPPATTTTTLPPCPDWNPWRYINTTRDATISQWVSHYERCNPTTRKTEHGCYLHGWSASTSPQPPPPLGTPKIGACP
jgi:hypothetical protein